MPPLCLHLGIAKEVAVKLQNPVVDKDLGSYFLGATSPDIRIITGASREATHFFDLAGDLTESGVGLFFQAYPRLAKSTDQDEPTKAFVAGYLSHLVTDEVYVLEIYRPCFSERSPLAGDPMATMLDRALQFELDRRERLDRDNMAAIHRELCMSPQHIDIGFIEPSALEEWQKLVCRAATREPTWERFRLFAERFLLPHQKMDREQLELFLGSVPTALGQVLEKVTPERIKTFREKSVMGSLEAIREYLG